MSYEESYGYMLGSYVRDKDAVTAAVAMHGGEVAVDDHLLGDADHVLHAQPFQGLGDQLVAGAVEGGVHHFKGVRPTPELSFAIREYGCIAGINITASHNPKEYTL